MTTAQFNRLMEWEGGGKLHRDPIGILTKWGVAETANPDVDVANLTEAEAMRIAEAKYWKPAKLDYIPEPFQYMVFDFAYNAGVGRAVRTFQTAMNDAAVVMRIDGFLRDGHVFLLVDGMPGPNTQGRAAVMAGSQSRISLLQRLFIFRRMEFYHGLAMMNPSRYSTSLNGWLRRALEAV